MTEQENVLPRPRGTVEGTPDVTGQAGVESAAGRDRTQGELPEALGANRGGGDVSGIVPPEGTVQGTRVGEPGDPTGSEQESGEE